MAPSGGWNHRLAGRAKSEASFGRECSDRARSKADWLRYTIQTHGSNGRFSAVWPVLRNIAIPTRSATTRELSYAWRGKGRRGKSKSKTQASHQNRVIVPPIPKWKRGNKAGGRCPVEIVAEFAAKEPTFGDPNVDASRRCERQSATRADLGWARLHEREIVTGAVNHCQSRNDNQGDSSRSRAKRTRTPGVSTVVICSV